jgi:hypothetical protein
MVSSTLYGKRARKVWPLAHLSACCLLTCCGLLDDLKDVPKGTDSVVLPNTPSSDAGEAGIFDAAVAATATEAGLNTPALTFVESCNTPTCNSLNSTKGSTSAASSVTTASLHRDAAAAEPAMPEAGHTSAEDSGIDASSDSDPTSTQVAQSDSAVFLDAGSAPTVKCGLLQPDGTPLCDPVAQCGCDIGQNCAYTPERQSLFTCVAPGTTAVQDACYLDDECEVGSACADGMCLKTCATNEDCPDDSQCEDVFTKGIAETNIRVCKKPCDPLEETSCGNGAMCAATSGAYPTCVRKTGQDGTDEEPCESDANCAQGFGCTADLVCRAWCKLADDLGDAVGVTDASANVCPSYSFCEPANNELGLGQCTAPCPVPAVDGSECSILPTACGCTEGKTCHSEQLGKTVCEVPGPNGYMTWCDRNSQCGAGLSCLANLCRPICDSEDSPCADGSSCAKTLTSEFSPSACLGHCDPVDPSSTIDGYSPCGLGAYCSPGFDGDSQIPESHCLRGTDLRPKLVGESCADDTDCDAGLGCDKGTLTCAPWCKSDGDCTNGTCYLDGSVRTREQDELLGWCR